MEESRDRQQRRARPTGSYDAEMARLTARADLIVEELDVVVKELSQMLESAYGIKNG